MQLRFDQMGSAPARALQIYLVLIGCAANQQTILYTALAKRLGLLTPTWLPASLSYLADWCLEEGLPPLTSLAVADDTGIPGPGYLDVAIERRRDPEPAPNPIVFEFGICETDELVAKREVGLQRLMLDRPADRFDPRARAHGMRP